MPLTRAQSFLPARCKLGPEKVLAYSLNLPVTFLNRISRTKEKPFTPNFNLYCPLPVARPVLLMVRRPEVRELIEEILVRPDLISCHLPVRQHREENIDNIVAECSTILRKGHWAARVVGKNVWQQLSGFPDCILTRIAAGVFQLMGEDPDEPIIFAWLPVQVRFSLLSRQENCLQRSPSAICLDPAFFSLVHCASPKSHPIGAQSRIGQFKHNAANILIREKIIASELHLVEQAMCVKKERIASPAKKTAIISGLRD